MRSTENEGFPIQALQPYRGYALQAERSKQRRVHFFKRSLSGGDGREGGGVDGGGGQGGGEGGGGADGGGGEGGGGRYENEYAPVLVHGPGSAVGR